MALQYVATNVSPSSGPITKKLLITPSDTEDIMQSIGDTRVPRCIEVATPGTVAYVPVENDEAEVFTDTIAAAPTIIPVAVRRVMETGTTATVRACY